LSLRKNHAHKVWIDHMDLTSICQDFLAVNDRRIAFFGKMFALASCVRPVFLISCF